MSKLKLKKTNPKFLPIKVGSYVLFNKVLCQVADISDSAAYKLIEVKSQKIHTLKMSELGYFEFIYASDLIKINDKTAKVLYGV